MARLDIESGLSSTDNTDARVRWGFIRKVYGILMAQLALTTLVSGFVVFVNPVNGWLGSRPWLLFVPSILALILLCPIYVYRQSHPLNLILLGLFTVCQSFVVGIACSLTKGHIVFEALILTATITVGLTLFTFWAVNRGYNFSFLGPFLFASLLLLLVWGLVQAFLPLVPMLTSVYALLGAFLFSGYIVYDTYNLIQRYDYDEYVWAALALYIDIVNLFLSLLQLLRSSSN